MADEDASFDDFYRTVRDRLVLQVTAVSGDVGEAADIVQEAFVRAWQRWPRICGYEDPEGWVRRVAFNLAVSRWRRARRVLLTPRLPAPAADADSMEPGAAGLISALAALPMPMRQAIVLHHLVGLSVAEIAAELSAPSGTVKAWLSRGRVRLAQSLEAEGKVSDDV